MYGQKPKETVTVHECSRVAMDGYDAPFHVASAPEKLCCSVEPIASLPQAQMTDRNDVVKIQGLEVGPGLSERR